MASSDRNDDFAPVNLDFNNRDRDRREEQYTSSHSGFPIGLTNDPLLGAHLDIFGPSGPEFLVVGDERKKRSFGENLFYYTGTAYLTGSVIGGVWGSGEAFKKSVGQPFRLQANAVINSSVKRGTLLGGNLGILAMGYTAMEWTSREIRDGEDDVINSVAAGVVAGSAFRAFGGVRAAAIGAAAGGAVAGVVRLLMDLRED